jgi:uncharacterized protein
MRKSWCVLLLLAAGAAHAASFDCSKAKTPQEKAICGSPELSAADEQMAAAYKALLATTTTEVKPAVRDNQRSWNLKTAADCKSSAPQPGATLATCLLASYKARIPELNRMLSDGDYKFVSKSIQLTTPDSPDGGQASPGTVETPGSGTLRATWPQSSKDSPQWIAWNRAMEAAVRKMASSDSQADPPAEWSKKWAEDTETTITVSVNYIGARLIAASIDSEWMGHGAAHPDGATSQFNWMINDKRELRPEDVFLPGSAWDKTIQERCARALQQQLGEGLEEGWQKQLRRIVLDSRYWKLDSEGLTVILDDQSMSPHAAPANPVKFPWVALKPFLQSGWPLS